MFGSAKSIVGLDIGSSCIKAIELKRAKGEIIVSHLGVEPLASDIVVDSMIVDSGSVSSAISEIFAEHNIKTRQVATSVSGHSVVDIDAFALQNCYEYNYQPFPDSTVALLNLGASVMNINIVKGSTPLF